MNDSRTRGYLWFGAAAIVVAFLLVGAIWGKGNDKALFLAGSAAVALLYIVNAIRALRQNK